MLATRVMPCLLLSGARLVKTVRFQDPKYVGDPRNAVKIFNEKEVDELVVLDIDATPERTGPRFELIREIVSEAFMPVAYGGGIRTLEDARAMFKLGVEKVILCSSALDNPGLVGELAEEAGGQSVLVCLDVKRGPCGQGELHSHGGRINTHRDPVAFALEMEARGAGELVLNAIDRDGTMTGFDLELIRQVSAAVSIPVIACGGAGKVADFADAVAGGASAVAAGSLFVFHGRNRAVLISYPGQAVLRSAFARVRGEGR